MKRTAILLFVLASFAIAPRTQAAVVSPTPVALSGTPSPAGINYKTFGSPLLSADGQIAFYSTLSTNSATGVFVGKAGSQTTLALRGDTAPGGSKYTAVSGPFAINSTGEVGFYATVNNVQNMLVGVPGSVQVAARIGDPAPAGSTYSSFTGVKVPILNDAGQVAFYAELNSGSSTSQGIFAGSPGAIQPIATLGSAAPLGGTYTELKSPLFYENNQIAFSASTKNGSSSAFGIYSGSPGAFSPIVLTGTATPVGGTFSSISSSLSSNSNGQAVFLSYLDGVPSPRGIFSGVQGSIQPVGLIGEPAPSGGDYYSFYAPAINRSGIIAFRAAVKSSTVSYGLFEGLPGAIQTVAISGDSAPAGAFFSDFTIFNPINASGQLAFVANLAGPGVDATNDIGLYAGTPGNLIKIVREGDAIDVDLSGGVDNRIVAKVGNFLSDGIYLDSPNSLNLNDSGVLAYLLTFTDGSSGIFTSYIGAAPTSGDFNHDGVVDTADYIVWRNGLGYTYSQADYDTWRTDFGKTIAAGSTLPSANAVPEPSPATLLLTVVLVVPSWFIPLRLRASA